MKQVFILVFLIQLFSCVSDKEEGTVVSDQTLVGLAQSTSSFTYYRNSMDMLQTDPSSEHGLFMRVRLNPKALMAMNDSVSSLISATFPDESMVVKEMYDFKGGPLSGYVVMYKLRTGSDNNYGWLWGEYQPNGTPVYSVSRKGDRCIGCHLQTSNADLVRTFSLH